jgi:O-antigen/teichoic acid export membrane protein
MASTLEEKSDAVVAANPTRKPLMAVLGRFIGVFSAFLVNAVIARLLPEGVFSDFQLLLSLLTPASWIAVLGLNASAVRLLGEESARHGDAAGVSLARHMLRVAALSAILAMPLWWIVLYVGTRYLGFPVPGDATLLAVFVTTVALIGFQQVLADCFFGHHDLGTAPFFTGGLMAGPISTLLFLIFFLGLAWTTNNTAETSQYVWQLAGVALPFRKPSLLEAMLALFAALAISLPLAMLTLRRLHMRLSPNVVPEQSALPLERIAKVGFGMLGMSITAYILTVLVDVWIAGKLFRDPAGQALVSLDWYIAARRLTFMAFITLQLAGSLVAPSAARFYYSEQTAELQQAMRKYAWYGGVPSLIAVLIMLTVPHWLLTSYMGVRFGGAATAVRILAFAPLFAAWAGHGGYALAATGHEKYSLVVNIVASIFVVVAGFPAAQHWQLEGLALVSVIGFVLKHGAEWLLARRLLGIWCHIY